MAEIKNIRVIRGDTGGVQVKAIEVLSDGFERPVVVDWVGDTVTGMSDEQLRDYAARILIEGKESS
ncbi:hypothetical protein [Halomonas sp. M4R1S46]|uniref:hypothetical protein n=1 Tax=Halomonas sp. M4R1S46 TaxID=2982692 RepID=UPI0021E4489B|nr:hypothetical protein [Halomonas sp. M4R1S46]UYG09583.1 hypothetical protein OCT48_09700 [Halomonas sp. M4R1S46]